MWNIYEASEILFTSLHDSRFMSEARRGEVRRVLLSSFDDH